MRLPVLSGHLQGELDVPSSAEGLVLFAHGSGSSRKSPRNQFVARKLREAGIATLLMDLLTPEEERLDLEQAHLRFDIPFLAARLLQATDWVGREDRVRGLSLAPTLLVVGGEDREVLEFNRAALRELRCEKELRVVPGATHLFEEPGALEEVALLAAAWFRRHLGSPEWAPSPGDRLDTSVRGA